MNVLFIGGTGIISSACSERALAQGMELYLLNRGESSRPVPDGAKVLRGDIRDPESVRRALGDLEFDAVVDWVAFTPEHIETDLALFTGRTRQYVFISSASAYQKPLGHLPITESTPLHNPFWGYSRDKIACEERLTRAYREDGFPVTIVRPSHTYDRTLLPMDGGWTVVDRMRRGKPVIVHGDGTSLWTLTHHRDFAVGFVGLLGRPAVLGEAVQITGDEWLTWNQIFELVAGAAGVKPQLVHVPSETIAAFAPNWGAGLLGDKAHSVIFDNSKIKRLVPEFRATIPYARGVREVLAWYDADPARQVVDEGLDRLMDEIIAQVRALGPQR
ncbi:SDR family oxidoreductase [Deinococcus radiopugnans]|uniref:Nucleoside-diphosphate-sugar epimerase n=1 Tax=Deinococcus radiopugnans ATCC 19172 TaxID=585398 RepID=A0A5C4XYW1_9DEIO|nr:SDR family oxidoreductase [Deinococcus radiopugnans]MBB6018051.1 nucleoside-diphosphate-sugar epimerase [Deinococcus radiopugnans ATCC 19172]TNM68694.1 SDR family oxidoreductase [Deinococcus radiopugnans ATCC 19172]